MEKPKRKYTLTEKALAANRRNLIRAREVDPKIRYRPTPKRLAACHANLTRALEVLRAASLTPDGYPRKSEITDQKSETGNSKLEDRNSKPENRSSRITNRKSEIANRQWPDSPAYGLGYTRGLCAISLRRSARLAGETAGAFDAHVARFVTALAPRTLREQRLARGIAEAVWRLFRSRNSFHYSESETMPSDEPILPPGPTGAPIRSAIQLGLFE